MILWQEIDINEIYYAEQVKEEILKVLTDGYKLFANYLDKNFLNYLEEFQNKSKIKIYHSADQRFATCLFEIRIIEYLQKIGAKFTTTSDKKTLINNFKKENTIKNINYPDFLITLDGERYFVEVTMPTQDKKMRRAIDIFNSGEKSYHDILSLLKEHKTRKKTEKWRNSYDNLTSMCFLYPVLEEKRYPLKLEPSQQFSMKEFLNACSLLRILFSDLPNPSLKQISSFLDHTSLSTKVLSGSDKDFKSGYNEYTFIYQVKNAVKNKIESDKFKTLQNLMNKEKIRYMLAISGGLISFINRPLLTKEYFSFFNNETQIDKLLLSLYAEGLMGNQLDFFFIDCKKNIETIEVFS